MKTLYLHVGMHKAGSTSIQTALNRERASLLDQGVYVPVTGTADNTRAHHNLAWELNRDKRFESENGTLADLHEELARVKANKAIISAEGFTSFDTKPGKARERRLGQALAFEDPVKRLNRYQRMRDLAQSLNYSIVIIGFVRDYVSCINSAYTQQIKTFSHGRSFYDHLKEQRRNERWCYGTVFAGWESIAQDVVCVASGEDNVAILFDLLNASMSDEQPRRKNTSVGPKSIESSRLLFKALERRAHNRVGRARDRGLVEKSELAPRKVVQDAGNLHGWNDAFYWGFTPDLAVTVQEEFVERDRAFLDRHGVCFGTSFSTRISNDFLVKDAPAAEREEFLRILEGMWGAFDLPFDRRQVRQDSKALRAA